MFLTERQLAVLNFIRDFITDKGISPTLDEMSQFFGVSKITIYEHVSALEKKGAIRKTRNMARAIELVDQPELRLIAPENPLSVGAGTHQTTSVFVIAPPSVFQNGVHPIRLRISDGAGAIREVSYKLVGPQGSGR